MDLLTLKLKRKEHIDRMRAFLDSKKGSDGFLSADDFASYQNMETALSDMEAQIASVEKLGAYDALNQPAAAPVGHKANAALGANTRKKDFWDRARKENFTAQNVMTTDIPGNGGYLVPQEFQTALVKGLEEENILRGISHIIKTASNSNIPVLATRGEAYLVEENDPIPESEDTFGRVTIGAYHFAALTKASKQLIEDAVFDIESYVASEASRKLARKEEREFLTGSGAAGPTGILADTGGAQLGLTASGASSFTMEDVIKLVYSLKAPYRRNASFIMNDATVGAVRLLADSSGQYLWQPSIQAGAPDTLMGRPVYTSAYMPTAAANAKTILFGDFSYFWIADRNLITFQALHELYAASGQVGFIVSHRCDAKVIMPEAIKYMKQKAS